MLVKLNEIKSNQSVSKTVVPAARQMETANGPVELEAIQGNLTIRRLHEGWSVDYHVTAKALLGCTRCGGEICRDIDATDSISVHIRQPDGSHLVLEGRDMNVRFLAEPMLDLEHLVLEAVDLELPDYPRHDEDNAACKSAFEETSQEEAETTSPFQGLAKFLSKENE